MSAPAKRGRPRKMRYARLMGDFWKHDKTKPLPLAVVGLSTAVALGLTGCAGAADAPRVFTSAH